MSVPEKYKHIDRTPPKLAAKVAKAAMERRRKLPPSKRGGLTTQQAGKLGIGSGLASASLLQTGKPWSFKKISMAHRFFSRHEKNYDPKDPNSKGSVSYSLWGGSPLKSWAAKVMRQKEAADKKK